MKSTFSGGIERSWSSLLPLVSELDEQGLLLISRLDWRGRSHAKARIITNGAQQKTILTLVFAKPKVDNSFCPTGINVLDPFLKVSILLIAYFWFSFPRDVSRFWHCYFCLPSFSYVITVDQNKQLREPRSFIKIIEVDSYSSTFAPESTKIAIWKLKRGFLLFNGRKQYSIFWENDCGENKSALALLRLQLSFNNDPSLNQVKAGNQRKSWRVHGAIGEWAPLSFEYALLVYDFLLFSNSTQRLRPSRLYFS